MAPHAHHAASTAKVPHTSSTHTTSGEVASLPHPDRDRQRAAGAGVRRPLVHAAGALRASATAYSRARCGAYSIPTRYRADLVVLLLDGRPVLAIVVEVQL